MHQLYQNITRQSTFALNICKLNLNYYLETIKLYFIIIKLISNKNLIVFKLVIHLSMYTKYLFTI